jgi:hypothetical protein
MLVINCYGEFSFGGRTEDIFVIEDKNSLAELQEYIETKQPIKCKEPTAIYKWSIIEEDSLRDRLVYLNNYMKIKEVGYLVLSKEIIDAIDETTCKGCTFNDGSLSSTLQCRFIPEKQEDDQFRCKTYEECFVSAFKKLFRKSK